MDTRFEIQRDRVHAEAFVGRGRAIIENMAEMRITSGTFHFGTVHPVGVVSLVEDAVFAHRLKKTWPAAAAGKLGIRAEEPVAAYGAEISSFGFAVPILAGKSALGTLLPGYVVQVSGQNPLPLGIADPQGRSVCTGIIRIALMRFIIHVIGLPGIASEAR